VHIDWNYLDFDLAWPETIHTGVFDEAITTLGKVKNLTSLRVFKLCSVASMLLSGFGPPGLMRTAFVLVVKSRTL
jgi:hypothetical protein